ncbi:hypothetical protein B0T17DRAFT_644611 [Bombardia bombarda]|uniref:Nuclear GTPase SLIP-GC n=1 Tax=Bombardia bombarda TaxID=252184 RepID=A0AA40BVU3_9PEZI|nr:hypothetical protein B0T17DRAFT_644611 [Bombardia bombarda]
MIKPYLDSMYTERAGKCGAVTRQMAVWPLIGHVEIYVKSELLKSGLVLVDLPGLSDAVEGRAAVARRYYQKLDVAVVVTEAVRAADEKTAVELMNDNQELSPCWATAAISEGRQDDVDKHAKLGKNLAAQRDQVEHIKRSVRKLKRKMKKAEGEDERNIRTEIKELRSNKKECFRQKVELHKALAMSEGAGTFAAIQSRNKLLIGRISEHLKQRHEAFLKQCPDAPPGFNIPNIFPVSSTAYWGLLEGEKLTRPQVGFPSVAYTGIPALIRWLEEATLPKRKRHVQSLLSQFVVLLDNMRTWSDDECKRHKVKFSREQVKDKILDPACTKLLENFQDFSKRLKNKVKKCDPLESKNKALESCGTYCNQIVDRWVYRKLHHLTFIAIIKREGGPFLSHGGGTKQTFDWMEDMAASFKRGIAGKWIEADYKDVEEYQRAVSHKVLMQGSVRDLLIRWNTAWLSAEQDTEMADTAIPAHYGAPEGNDSWSDLEDEDMTTDSDPDSDSDLEADEKKDDDKAAEENEKAGTEGQGKKANRSKKKTKVKNEDEAE